MLRISSRDSGRPGRSFPISSDRPNFRQAAACPRPPKIAGAARRLAHLHDLVTSVAADWTAPNIQHTMNLERPLTASIESFHNNPMRVVSGQSKGRRLLSPRGQTVRPTQAKVKEALFDILANLVTGARVLDLFAGTGGIGIEALSRGAESVDFVERHSTSRNVLEENLKRCGYQSRARIHRLDAVRFLRQAARTARSFDIVFVDPPYHTGILKTVLPLLSQDVIITQAGVVIIEHFHKTELPDVLGPLHRFRARRYGDTVLSFYKKHSRREPE